MDDLKKLSEMSPLTDDKARARQASVRACRAMEQALRQTLKGERLHGMPNLGTGAAPWLGSRIRGDYDNRLANPDSGRHGPEVLCLDSYGRLVFARLVRGGAPLHVEAREADDAELVAEDAEDLADVLAIAVRDHMSRGDTERERFADIQATSERLLAVLEIDGRPVWHLLAMPGTAGAGVRCGEARFVVATTEPGLVTCEDCRANRRDS